MWWSVVLWKIILYEKTAGTEQSDTHIHEREPVYTGHRHNQRYSPVDGKRWHSPKLLSDNLVPVKYECQGNDTVRTRRT